MLREIAFAAEEMHPSDDPDDFAELMKRVMRAIEIDVVLYSGLRQAIVGHLGDREQAYGHDLAAGRIVPTPRYRRAMVGLVRTWLQTAQAAHA